MNYLLDVNLLVTWGWSDHADHRRTAQWIGAMKANRDVKLMTSAIPELGFVRVSVQRAPGRLSVADATATLRSMLKSLKSRHLFLPDDVPSTLPLPTWCQTAAQSNDAHLFALAKSHNAELATLDTGIPGAFLIPPI